MLIRSSRLPVLLAVAVALCLTATGCDQFMSSAMIYLQQNPPDYEKAIVQLKEGISMVPENGNYYRMLAYCYFNNRQYKEARESYDNAVKLLPDKKDSLEKARLENWDDLYRGAHTYAGKISKAPPESLQAAVAKAQQALDNAIVFMPSNDLNLMMQAFIYQQAGRAEDARKAYLKAVEINPQNSKAYVLLGKTAYNDTKYDQAIDYFSKAVAINPADTNSQFLLGLSFFASKKYEQAIAPFRKANALNPDDRDALINLAKCLMLEDKTPQLAIDPLEKALQLKEDDETWYLLGLVALNPKVNDIDRGMRAFKRATELKPAMRDYWVSLHSIYKTKKMKAELKLVEQKLKELK
ncbi:MAG: tetratricopeptide repeat protein [Candidatus Edwardsbacteria bacterium]|jgi:cytochrome c-type biogenesis protein CcmH/NrfG|nr:tetratricopeptide repeat protein [Candidatus Edwardsbacteria bacterium]